MTTKTVFTAMACMLFATPIFAADGSTGSDMRLPAAYLAMGLASGLCGLGQAKAVAAAAEAMARNPAAQASIRFALILGLVLIESLALYTLVITYIAK